MRIGILGLGKVGWALANVLARHEFDVVGMEVDLNRLKSLPDVKGIQKMQQPSPELESCQVVFCCAQTPSKPNHRFSLQYVERATRSVVPLLDEEAVIAVESTINAGDTDRLSKFWDKIVYNPVMIRQGTIEQDLENPPYVLIGGDKRNHAETIRQVWMKVVPEHTPFIIMNARNMEITKLTLNFALTLKISMINAIGEFCEQHKGDFDQVIKPFLLDKRLSGDRMWSCGLGFGGPCFPRDVKNWAAHSKNKELPRAIERVNRRQIERSVNRILSFGKKNVAVLGLAYKPDTPLTDESQALMIAQALESRGLNVYVYDPLVKPNLPLKECIAHADIVFIAVPWEEFKTLDRKDFRLNHIVVDPWRLLRDKSLGCEYVAYGVSGAKF
jgi:UDPglucose 6-dehydrogenase